MCTIWHRGFVIWTSREGAPGLLVVRRDAGLVIVQAPTVLEVLAAELARHQPVGGRDRLLRGVGDVGARLEGAREGLRHGDLLATVFAQSSRGLRQPPAGLVLVVAAQADLAVFKSFSYGDSYGEFSDLVFLITMPPKMIAMT